MSYNHRKWITKVIGQDSLRAASLKAGQSQNWLQQQLKRGLTTDGIISLCRAYDYPISQALIELNILKPHELATFGVEQALQYATNKQLLAEIERRIESSDTDAVLHFTGKENNAHDMPIPFGDLPADGDLIDITQYKYVADNSPIEPEQGDDDYTE